MLAGPLPNKVNFCQYADSGSLLEGNIPLDRFDRLSKLVRKPYGEVSAFLRFYRDEHERVSVTGTVNAEVQLICQSCLESMSFQIACDVNVLLLGTEAELLDLSQDDDGILVETPVAKLTDMVEDEMILSLPMISRHGGQCGNSDEPVSDEPAEVTTHRPFAGLSRVIDKQAVDKET